MLKPDFFKKAERDREEDKRRSELLYRNVFLENENGRLVLNSLLQQCGLLRMIGSEEQRILHNWGVYLLANLGLDTMSATGMVDYGNVIDALARGKGVVDARS